MVYLYLDVLDWLNGAFFGIVPPQACLVFKAKTTVQHILFRKPHTRLTVSVTQKGVAASLVLLYIIEFLVLLFLQSCLFSVFRLHFFMIHAFAGHFTPQKHMTDKPYVSNWPKKTKKKKTKKISHRPLASKLISINDMCKSKKVKDCLYYTFSYLCNEEKKGKKPRWNHIHRLNSDY